MIMIIEHIDELRKLNAKQKLILLSELWSSIITDTDLPITEEEKAILEERYRKFKKNPQSGSSWNKIYEELKTNS